MELGLQFFMANVGLEAGGSIVNAALVKVLVSRRARIAGRWSCLVRWVGVAVAIGIGSCGCARYRPARIDTVPFLDSAATQSADGLRVTVAVPSDAQSEALFGVPVAERGIQPVWVEIENRGAQGLWFAPLALDPEYFTPLEAANRCRYRFSSTANAAMRAHFLARAIGPYAAPGDKISGFVFANLDRGIKAVNVALIGRDRFEQRFFLVALTNLHADYQRVAFDDLYDRERVHEVDEAELRTALEQLPGCATTTADGQGVEDPLNFVLIGTKEEILPSFVRAGWHVTEILERRSALKTFWSYFFGAEYKYAPISPIYLFGRRQDLSLQKARETARERNHLRLWLAPLRFAGKPVWVGQISRDIGLVFDWKNIVGHEVDPDVDEARNYLVQDMLRAQGLARFGWLRGVGAAPQSAPHHMADGTPFFTDGLRAVMVFAEESRSLEQIGLFDWETLPPK